IHPIAIYDHRTSGTKYSTRSANAAACVANWAPDAFWEFHGLLLENRPPEGQPGLEDDRLIELARQAGANRGSTVEHCVRDQSFRAWVSQASDRALNQPVPGTDLSKVESVPLIIVEDLVYRFTLTEDGRFDPDEFARLII